jgi:hypothetical protein
VAVPEHQDVGVGEAGGAAQLAPLGVAGLVDDGEPDALDLGVRDLRQPPAEGPVVVVAVDRHQPPRPLLEPVQQGGVHPVAGMDHDVGVVDRGPQGMR